MTGQDASILVVATSPQRAPIAGFALAWLLRLSAASVPRRAAGPTIPMPSRRVFAAAQTSTPTAS